MLSHVLPMRLVCRTNSTAYSVFVTTPNSMANVSATVLAGKVSGMMQLEHGEAQYYKA